MRLLPLSQSPTPDRSPLPRHPNKQTTLAPSRPKWPPGKRVRMCRWLVARHGSSLGTISRHSYNINSSPGYAARETHRPGGARGIGRACTMAEDYYKTTANLSAAVARRVRAPARPPAPISKRSIEAADREIRERATGGHLTSGSARVDHLLHAAGRGGSLWSRRARARVCFSFV